MGGKDNGPLLDRDASNCKKMQKITAKYPKECKKMPKIAGEIYQDIRIFKRRNARKCKKKVTGDI